MRSKSQSLSFWKIMLTSIVATCALALAFVAWSPLAALADETDPNTGAGSVQTSDQNQTSNLDIYSASDPEPTPDSMPEPMLSGIGHVQDYGDRTAASVDGVLVLGTTGEAKRLEAIIIMIDDAPENSVEYRAHVENIGWMNTVSEGQTAGTNGKGYAIESVQIRLVGALADTHDVWYRAHVQNNGWMGWTCNNNYAGTTGRGLRLEALEIKLLPKGDSSQDIEAYAFSAPTFTGKSHVQDYGTLNQSADDTAILGTTGAGKKLEAFSVALGDGAPANESIMYRAHVENIGWTDTWQRNGEIAGTSGMNRRIEAVQIKLDGTIAETHQIWYRVHVANIGWLGWTTGGAFAGTEGSGARAEALEIQLRPIGNDITDPTPAYLNANRIQAAISTFSDGAKDWETAGLSETSGTTGRNRPLLGLSATIDTSEAGIDGSINYAMHLSHYGWTDTWPDGKQLGTFNPANKIEAVSFSLGGDASKYFDVYYRTHVSGVGWIGWASNGTAAGSSGLEKSIEAIEVCVVVKGGIAPGSTTNNFSDENGFLAPYPAHVRNMLAYAQGFSSATNNLILVDTGSCNMVIFRGSAGNWSVDTYDQCVCGAWGSPTITGTYTTGYHLDSLPAYPNALYCTNITGGYFFHSILNSTSELGQHLSHGCVRLNWPLAQYVQSLPYGTTVHLY